jgi:hypothetical protein
MLVTPPFAPCATMAATDGARPGHDVAQDADAPEMVAARAGVSRREHAGRSAACCRIWPCSPRRWSCAPPSSPEWLSCCAARWRPGNATGKVTGRQRIYPQAARFLNPKMTRRRLHLTVNRRLIRRQEAVRETRLDSQPSRFRAVYLEPDYGELQQSSVPLASPCNCNSYLIQHIRNCQRQLTGYIVCCLNILTPSRRACPHGTEGEGDGRLRPSPRWGG